MRPKMNLSICLKCAAIMPALDEIVVTCSKCGYVVDPSFYKELIKHAQMSLEFGYRYRKIYEAEYESTGSAKSRYSLIPPSDILVFLALAAISGIIGGASYDMVKIAINKIKKQLDDSRIIKDKNSKDYMDVLFDNKEYEEFMIYIDDYCGNFKDLKNKEIKKAIWDEIYVDVRMGEDNPEMINIRSDIIKGIAPRKTITRLLKSRFDRFWENINKE